MLELHARVLIWDRAARLRLRIVARAAEIREDSIPFDRAAECGRRPSVRARPWRPHLDNYLAPVVQFSARGPRLGIRPEHAAESSSVGVCQLSTASSPA